MKGFAPGDTVIYVGGQAKNNCIEGVVTRPDAHSSSGSLVQFPNDPRGPRYFANKNLRKVIQMSIASRVKAALSNLICFATPSTVNLAARDLLAATLLCSAADAAKKRAKKVLQDLGITLNEYRPGTIRCFEDNEFTIDAVTKTPASRLDQALLTTKLRAAGLSQAKITSCLNAATVESKAATSIVVTEK